MEILQFTAIVLFIPLGLAFHSAPSTFLLHLRNAFGFILIQRNCAGILVWLKESTALKRVRSSCFKRKTQLAKGMAPLSIFTDRIQILIVEGSTILGRSFPARCRVHIFQCIIILLY